jgi:lipoprotein-anchoring transpeptidase ErfK/SrfK
MRTSRRDAVVQSVEHVLDAAQKPVDKVEAVVDQYERNKAAPPVDPAVDANITEVARGCESKTEWLIVVDCNNNRMGIFRGAKDAWTNTEFITVSCGADDGRETERGTFAVEDRGYSFNGFDEEFKAYYTCYYWVRFAGPYLIHSQPYHLESFDVMDDRIGQNVSQGCVRLPLEKAKWVYDNIPIGTTVVTF